MSSASQKTLFNSRTNEFVAHWYVIVQVFCFIMNNDYVLSDIFIHVFHNFCRWKPQVCEMEDGGINGFSRLIVYLNCSANNN